MPHKKQHENFRLTFPVLIRLLIFFAIFIFLVNYLSRSTSPSVLGEVDRFVPPDLTKNLGNQIYNSLPPKSQKFLQNVPQSDIVKKVSSTVQDFDLQKIYSEKLKEVKKYIIKSITDEFLK